MQEHFRLGIFTSATQRTVGNVLPLLEQAAGPGTPLFADPSLILHRSVGLPESFHMVWQAPALNSQCNHVQVAVTTSLIAQWLFLQRGRHSAACLNSSESCE